MRADPLASICDVCRRLHARNLPAAADGNVSALPGPELEALRAARRQGGGRLL